MDDGARTHLIKRSKVKFKTPNSGLQAEKWSQIPSLSLSLTRGIWNLFQSSQHAHSSRFAPLYPNTGYYLIRANRRTQLYNAQRATPEPYLSLSLSLSQKCPSTRFP